MHLCSRLYPTCLVSKPKPKKNNTGTLVELYAVLTVQNIHSKCRPAYTIKQQPI